MPWPCKQTAAICLERYGAAAAPASDLQQALRSVSGIRVLDKSQELKFSYRETKFSKINIPTVELQALFSLTVANVLNSNEMASKYLTCRKAQICNQSRSDNYVAIESNIF